MMLVLLISLTCTTLVSLELRVGGLHRERAQARFNAMAAARMALGELQLRVGRDQAATAPMPERAGWMGAITTTVMGADRTPPVPLVSGNWLLDTTSPAPLGWAELAREQTTPAGDFPAVTVPWMGDATGRMAFWIQDEAQKADAGTREVRESVALPDIQARRQLASARHALDRVWQVRRADPLGWQEALNGAATWRWLEQAWREGGETEEMTPLVPRLHTWASYGVLSDTVRGGLRINWDQREPDALPEEKLPVAQQVWEAFLRPEEAFMANPARGLPVTPMTPEVALRCFPILSGLRVRFGFFNTRSDGYHRTRFNADVQLWNPTPYPLFCVDAARIGLLDFETMPVVTVTNQYTGGAVSVDMSAFPVGQFGLARQTASDGTANAWVELYDGRRFGMAAPGLLAGEVYNFVLPNPVAQPQGLSRVLSATTWKMQTDLKKPDRPPSGANGAHWFHATHPIEIRGIMPAEGVTLHIRTAKGSWSSAVPSRDYSPPVLTLKHVPFRNFSLTLSGADYNRAQSTTYVADEARIALSLRLRGNDPARLAAVLETLDPREPVLDFRDPRVASLYEVIVDVEHGKGVPLTSVATEGFWWDAQDNAHDGDGEPFAEARVLDRPATAPLSVGVLRHLPRAGESAGSLNPQYPVGRESDTAWFDQAFFAGAWPENDTDDSIVQRPWSRNPWLEPLGGAIDRMLIPSREDAAAQVLVRGMFNVNCTEVEPWRAVLARELPEWARRAGNDTAEPKRNLSNVMLRLPFGADQPRQVGESRGDLSDAELREAGAKLWARCAGLQGFRALEDERRDRLAEVLAAAIQRYQEREGGGFRSLAEFALSGVIAEAIEEAECNTAEALGKTPPAVSPLRLNPGDLLESLLPVLSVRGDTFKVRVRGAALNPTGTLVAQADLEVVVQRFPEFCDTSQAPMTPAAEWSGANWHYGRRLRIVSWRWLDAGE